jgi:hypothetical protein
MNSVNILTASFCVSKKMKINFVKHEWLVARMVKVVLFLNREWWDLEFEFHFYQSTAS